MDVTIRRLADDDVDAAREVQTAAFRALDQAAGEPASEVTPDVAERQRHRVRHFRSHDPGGSWVAVVAGQVVGVALALRRESLWGLSLLVVDPAHQSNGIGRLLLDASLTYADGCDAAIILSSRDPRAMRRYAAAGFDLFPQVGASGPVDRSRLAAPSRAVRRGGEADAGWADAIDRQVRGAARGPDHALFTASSQMYVVDDDDGRGYAYLRSDGRVYAVAATDDDTAAVLLTHCLLADDLARPDRSIDHITAEQQWAVRVAVTAGLQLKPSGPVFWRGRTPPQAYLPNGAVL